MMGWDLRHHPRTTRPPGDDAHLDWSATLHRCLTALHEYRTLNTHSNGGSSWVVERMGWHRPRRWCRTRTIEAGHLAIALALTLR